MRVLLCKYYYIIEYYITIKLCSITIKLINKKIIQNKLQKTTKQNKTNRIESKTKTKKNNIIIFLLLMFNCLLNVLNIYYSLTFSILYKYKYEYINTSTLMDFIHILLLFQVFFKSETKKISIYLKIFTIRNNKTRNYETINNNCGNTLERMNEFYFYF
jgi:uncharacterized membrane protein YdjX (TVP38/TMEM64 family)